MMTPQDMTAVGVNEDISSSAQYSVSHRAQPSIHPVHGSRQTRRKSISERALPSTPGMNRPKPRFRVPPGADSVLPVESNRLPYTVPGICLRSRARGIFASWQPETHKAHLVKPRKRAQGIESGCTSNGGGPLLCAPEQASERHRLLRVRRELTPLDPAEASALLAVVRAPDPGSVEAP